MNGTEHKIEIFKPFGEAYDLMSKILFKPFGFKKWCVIGFAAFLSGHFSAGGIGFSYQQRQSAPNIQMPEWLQAFKPWLPVIIVAGVLFLFAFILVLMWIRARGTFVFTDCLVHNRGAIAAPWREYRKEGNSYFLFGLAVALIAMVVFCLLGLVIFGVGVMGLGHQNNPSPVAMITGIGILLLLWIPVGVLLSLILHFMAPVMYVRRCGAVDAFREVFRLVMGRLGTFILLSLFAIVLLMAMMAIGTIVSCATCCLASLPYVGTVIMLPVFVCLRLFGLRFLSQFGPDYDVWSTLPPAPPPLPETPQIDIAGEPIG